MPTGAQLLSLYFGVYFTLLVVWAVYETRSNQLHHGHANPMHTFAMLPLIGMVLYFWPFLLMAYGTHAICAWAMRRRPD